MFLSPRTPAASTWQRPGPSHEAGRQRCSAQVSMQPSPMPQAPPRNIQTGAGQATASQQLWQAAQQQQQQQQQQAPPRQQAPQRQPQQPAPQTQNQWQQLQSQPQPMRAMNNSNAPISSSAVAVNAFTVPAVETGRGTAATSALDGSRGGGAGIIVGDASAVCWGAAPQESPMGALSRKTSQKSLQASSTSAASPGAVSSSAGAFLYQAASAIPGQPPRSNPPQVATATTVLTPRASLKSSGHTSPISKSNQSHAVANSSFHGSTEGFRQPIWSARKSLPGSRPALVNAQVPGTPSASVRTPLRPLRSPLSWRGDPQASAAPVLAALAAAATAVPGRSGGGSGSTAPATSVMAAASPVGPQQIASSGTPLMSTMATPVTQNRRPSISASSSSVVQGQSTNTSTSNHESGQLQQMPISSPVVMSRPSASMVPVRLYSSQVCGSSAPTLPAGSATQYSIPRPTQDSFCMRSPASPSRESPRMRTIQEQPAASSGHVIVPATPGRMASAPNDTVPDLRDARGLARMSSMPAGIAWSTMSQVGTSNVILQGHAHVQPNLGRQIYDVGQGASDQRLSTSMTSSPSRCGRRSSPSRAYSAEPSRQLLGLASRSVSPIRTGPTFFALGSMSDRIPRATSSNASPAPARYLVSSPNRMRPPDVAPPEVLLESTSPSGRTSEAPTVPQTPNVPEAVDAALSEATAAAACSEAAEEDTTYGGSTVTDAFVESESGDAAAHQKQTAGSSSSTDQFARLRIDPAPADDASLSAAVCDSAPGEAEQVVS